MRGRQHSRLSNSNPSSSSGPSSSLSHNSRSSSGPSSNRSNSNPSSSGLRSRPKQQQPQQGRAQQPQQAQQGHATRPQAVAWQQQKGWLKQGGGWQGHSTWAQNGDPNWNNDHRTWAQRGGYGGYYIPENTYNLHFGDHHWFRMHGMPAIYMGYPRFSYEGFWFMLVDPWPGSWAENWYANDDVYIDYDDGYYLCNRAYPGVRLALMVSL